MAQIVRSERAEHDLEDIWLYIAADNPVAATQMLERIETAIHKLAEHPRIGHVREELPEGLRVIAVGNYLIVYEIVTEGILIVTVRHGARDLRRLFDDLREES